MAKPKGYELAGYADVDSGQLAIVDPCYIMPCARDGKGDDKLLDYDTMLEARYADSAKKQGCKQWECGPDANQMQASGHATMVVSDTGYGDGTYPVYVKRNSEGRIVRMLVVMG